MYETWVQTLIWRKPPLGVPNFLDRVFVVIGDQIQIAAIEFGVFFDHQIGKQLSGVQWWAECNSVPAIFVQEQAA
ncbi:MULTISPECIES: hypothetical protein [Burkholderia cepacia complex]|uniref:Uncharacterized protein n=1 Tax=Burkholderia ubonensis TaxID=101571 RepID=A0A1B4LBV8_9BURK|nr:MULTISPECIES: hypothetical protein [Burkholderia cepacia complex]AOJ74657.1 hypothetical protein WJ35_05940 [Burkholderia ubonensis]AOK09748.1 hypothetical protein WK31_05565 [Burkholderia vietnamiensis]